MSSYTSFTDYVRLRNDSYRLIKPLVWELGRKGSGLVWTVPAGFIFDVSIPKIFHWIVSPHDRRFLLAAAIHDHMLVDGWSGNRAAIEFYHGLRATGCGKFLSVVMSAAVLGWSAFS
jgi:hypothetical protein